jgi:hypothetical protein
VRRKKDVKSIIEIAMNNVADGTVDSKLWAKEA